MQELPQAASGAPFFEARRWRSLVAALIALASSSAAFAQLNTPPLFTSIPPTSATEDVPYSYSITTTDLNVGDTRTLTAPTKPAWLTFTPGANGSGTLAGTPAQAQVGNHPVVLSVSDGTVSVTQSFTIVVANVDDQPVFTSTPVTAATEDVPYSYAITATRCRRQRLDDHLARDTGMAHVCRRREWHRDAVRHAGTGAGGQPQRLASRLRWIRAAGSAELYDRRHGRQRSTGVHEHAGYVRDAGCCL